VVVVASVKGRAMNLPQHYALAVMLGTVGTASVILGLEQCAGCTPAEDAKVVAVDHAVIPWTDAACQIATDVSAPDAAVAPFVDVICVTVEGAERALLALGAVDAGAADGGPAPAMSVRLRVPRALAAKLVAAHPGAG